MKIGIIVAMSKEMELLLPMLEGVEEKEIGGVKFHVGNFCGHEIAVRRCGIGKVNAAVGTVELIERFSPDLVINTGVAGGTGSDAKILDVVVATGVAYHDVWCGPDTKWGNVQGLPAIFPTVDWSETLAGKVGAKSGLVASGDIFVARIEDFNRIMTVWPQAKAIDMESGAIAHVCYLRGVPFVCIRVISDTPGQADNISQYSNFLGQAPEETFRVLRSAIESL